MVAIGLQFCTVKYLYEGSLWIKFGWIFFAACIFFCGHKHIPIYWVCITSTGPRAIFSSSEVLTAVDLLFCLMKEDCSGLVQGMWSATVQGISKKWRIWLTTTANKMIFCPRLPGVSSFDIYNWRNFSSWTCKLYHFLAEKTCLCNYEPIYPC